MVCPLSPSNPASSSRWSVVYEFVVCGSICSSCDLMTCWNFSFFLLLCLLLCHIFLCFIINQPEFISNHHFTCLKPLFLLVLIDAVSLQCAFALPHFHQSEWASPLEVRACGIRALDHKVLLTLMIFWEQTIQPYFLHQPYEKKLRNT